VKALETHYGGYRFRSRLEARWAVALTVAGIEWEYEPQGFECTRRLTAWGDESDTGFPYLPDFWLPRQKLWAEVKGSMDESDTLKVLDAAASLSTDDGIGCHDSGGYDMVILGPIKNQIPWILHMHEGTLFACLFGSEFQHCPWVWGEGWTVGGDGGRVDLGITRTAELLLAGSAESAPPGSLWGKALEAGRKARFEHGEHG
jgi:hypothetical protein